MKKRRYSEYLFLKRLYIAGTELTNKEIINTFTFGEYKLDDIVNYLNDNKYVSFYKGKSFMQLPNASFHLCKMTLKGKSRYEELKKNKCNRCLSFFISILTLIITVISLFISL